MGQRAALNTVVMTNQLPHDPDHLDIRSVVLTRFSRKHPLHKAVYQRLSAAMNKPGGPAPIFDNVGRALTVSGTNGKLWNVEDYRNVYGDDEKMRAIHAFELIRWTVESEALVGTDDNGAGLYHDLERAPVEILAAIAKGLSGEAYSLEHLPFVIRFQNLSESGRSAYVERFGDQPFPGLCDRKRDRDAVQVETRLRSQEKTESMRRFRRMKRGFAGVLALGFALFVAVSPYDHNVYLSVLEQDGLMKALSYVGRSGFLHFSSPDELRTAAYLYYRSGNHKKVIHTVRKIETSHNVSVAILGDAYLVEGHSRLALGELHSARGLYQRAYSTYHDLSQRTFATAGLAKVDLVLCGPEKARMGFERVLQEYKRAGNIGDLASYAYWFPKVVDYETAQEHCFKYLHFYESRKDKYGIATMNLCLAQLYFVKDIDLSRKYAIRAMITAQEKGLTRTEIMAKVILSKIEANSDWMASVNAYLENNKDFMLSRFVEEIDQHIH